MARAIAERYGWKLAALDKSRIGHNQVGDGLGILGVERISDSVCLLIDDLADTLGTMNKGSSALMKANANRVFGAVTHAVLSGNALDNIHNGCLEKIWVSDSIRLTEEAKKEKKLVQVTAAGLFADAITAIHNDRSISALFPQSKKR